MKNYQRDRSQQPPVKTSSQ